VKLYNYWRSSASWRVRIALAYKDVAYEYVAVNIAPSVKAQHQAEYQKLNPMQQVPTLVLDDGRQLAQSMAILEYLEETVPQPPLLPSDPYLRARARQLAELVNAGIQPFQNLPTMAKISELGGDAKEFVRGYIARGLDGLAASAEATAGTFLVGDAPSFADVCLVPQLYNARRFNVPVDDLPTLLRAEANANKLDGFARSHPDVQEQQ
jgi:maleylpyruvate isomerase